MIEDKLYKDYVEAFKKRDKIKKQFLSFLRSGLKNKAIELKKDKLEDSEVFEVLKKEKKKLLESKESLEKAGNPEQLKEVEEEIAIVDSYLPQPLPDDKIKEIIDNVIGQENANSMKDMGKVMKKVLAEVSSKGDPKKISQLVRQKLSGN